MIDYLVVLAETSRDCPNVWHHMMGDNPENVIIRHDNCPTCSGVGKVPLIPRLTQVCPQCNGHPCFDPTHPTSLCGHCGGTGQVPVSGAEALDALLDFALSQHFALGQSNQSGASWQVTFEREKKKLYTVYLKSSDCLIDTRGAGWTKGEPLAQALHKALKLVTEDFPT